MFGLMNEVELAAVAELGWELPLIGCDDIMPALEYIVFSIELS